MIRFVRGRAAERGKGYIVVDVGGVGFMVLTPDSSPTAIPESGGEITLHTRLHVREDAITLFGFSAAEEAGLFDLLVSVSGVGPKVALGILAACRLKRFLEMVIYEDTDGLGRLPGVGKKLSQRLVIELRDKLAPGREQFTASELVGGAAVAADAAQEAVEALVSLGYGRVEAAQAVEKAKGQLGEKAETADLIKAALKRL